MQLGWVERRYFFSNRWRGPIFPAIMHSFFAKQSDIQAAVYRRGRRRKDTHDFERDIVMLKDRVIFNAVRESQFLPQLVAESRCYLRSESKLCVAVRSATLGE